MLAVSPIVICFGLMVREVTSNCAGGTDGLHAQRQAIPADTHEIMIKALFLYFTYRFPCKHILRLFLRFGFVLEVDL